MDLIIGMSNTNTYTHVHVKISSLQLFKLVLVDIEHFRGYLPLKIYITNLKYLNPQSNNMYVDNSLNIKLTVCIQQFKYLLHIPTPL